MLRRSMMPRMVRLRPQPRPRFPRRKAPIMVVHLRTLPRPLPSPKLLLPSLSRLLRFRAVRTSPRRVRPGVVGPFPSRVIAPRTPRRCGSSTEARAALVARARSVGGSTARGVPVERLVVPPAQRVVREDGVGLGEVLELFGAGSDRVGGRGGGGVRVVDPRKLCWSTGLAAVVL